MKKENPNFPIISHDMALVFSIDWLSWLYEKIKKRKKISKNHVLYQNQPQKIGISMKKKNGHQLEVGS